MSIKTNSDFVFKFNHLNAQQLCIEPLNDSQVTKLELHYFNMQYVTREAGHYTQLGKNWKSLRGNSNVKFLLLVFFVVVLFCYFKYLSLCFLIHMNVF